MHSWIRWPRSRRVLWWQTWTLDQCTPSSRSTQKAASSLYRAWSLPASTTLWFVQLQLPFYPLTAATAGYEVLPWDQYWTHHSFKVYWCTFCCWKLSFVTDVWTTLHWYNNPKMIMCWCFAVCFGIKSRGNKCCNGRNLSTAGLQKWSITEIYPRSTNKLKNNHFQSVTRMATLY